jgi:outer membrane autotransporter protein
VQVNYSNVAYDDFTDRFGGRVSLRTGESLLGRGGFSINHQHTWRDAAGQVVRSDVYGIANAYYEFMNGNVTLVSDTAFASSIDRLWASIGAGGTFSWANDKYALFGEVSYNSSLNQVGDSYSYKGTAGFRVRW